MEFGDFRIRIDDINANLIQMINERVKTFSDYQKSIFESLSNNKQKHLDNLSSLEKKFYDNSEEKTQTISSIKSIITHIKENLVNELNEYLSTHNANIEKEKILNQKDNVLGNFKSQKKKETQDINQKIANLDRECLTILKGKSQAFDEEEKTYKTKVFDLERKMKYEVSKINEAILTPILNDKEDNEQEKISHDYKVNKEITDFRIKGINEISAIKKKYLEEIKKEEIQFNVYTCNYEKESAIIREEYKQKIEILKYEKINIQDELQNQLDLYDFDAYKKTNLLEKEYRLEENTINNNYNVKRFSYLDQIHASLVGQSNQKKDDVCFMYKSLKDYDVSQLDNIYTYLLEKNNLLQDKNSYLFESLNNVINIYLEMMVNLINEFWDNFYSQEKAIIEVLVISNYSSPVFNSFNFIEYLNSINKLFSEFKKNQKSRLDTFMLFLNELFKKLCSNLEEIFIEVTNYKNQEKSRFEELINKTKQIIIGASNDGIDHYSNLNSEENNAINEIINKDEVNKSEDIKSIDTSNNLIKEDFIKKSKDLEEKINNYNKKFQSSKQNKEKLFKENLTNIKNTIEEIKKKNIKDIKIKTQEINKKYENEIRVIEEERKTKIKIGQI